MAVNVASEEYSDSLQGVSTDPYDVSSWSILLDEVMGGRGGTASVVDTLQKFLKQFPRSGKTWGWLAAYHVNNGQLQAAEELLREELPKLRHVDLWSQYIKIVKRLVPKDAKDEKYSAARKAYENAFERALENVGYSVESGPIWKEYIDFLKDLPDAGMDPAKKREVLRNAYQRALAAPNEQLEELWKAYELFERYAGELSAKEILPDVEKKLLSAKAIFRERKRMVAKITFDRHAVPASAASGQQRQKELEQLDLWNKWIKYEKGNPENLEGPVLGEVLQMVYEQCLCCLRFHPEIWLSLAKFKIKEGGGLKGMAAARKVMNEAVTVLPGVALLRVAYAEFEEQWGSPDTARKILDEAFTQLPCGLLFAVKQRFIRRRDGIVAARQFFSDTLPMRLDKKLGYEVYVSHALVELDINCSPDVALRVLELARSLYPAEAHTPSFIRLLVRVLLRLGELGKIRWAFQVVLGEGGSAAVRSVSSTGIGGGGGGSGALNSGETASAAAVAAAATSAGALSLSLRDQAELWEDYLTAETLLGLSSIERLNELQKHRDAARSAFEDAERAKHIIVGSAAIAAAEIAAAARAEGIFEFSNDLLERYSGICCSVLDADVQLGERSRSFGPRPMQGFARRGAAGEAGGAGAAAASTTAGMPPLLRAFINKLPTHPVGAPLPDYDAFARHLRVLVLPPRPAVEDEVGGKRGGLGADASSSEWLNSINNEDDDAGDDLTSATRDDVFRQRQRARLL